MAPAKDPEDWGTIGNLSAKEAASLEQVKKRIVKEGLEEHYGDDKTLLRFCRARKFKVDKVMRMINENDLFLAQFRHHDFRLADFGSLLQFSDAGAAKFCDHDKLGRPVLVMTPRQFFPSHVEKDEDLVYFFIYYFWAVVEKAESRGREDFTVIIDLEGWTFKNFSLPITRLLLNLLQNHFPERLGRVYVVNTPFVFKAAWNMVQPLLDARTRMKIHILGKKYERLVEEIAPEVLQSRYGGLHEDYPCRDELIQVLYDKEEQLLQKADEAVVDSSTDTESAGSQSSSSQRDSAGKSKRRLRHRISSAVRRLKFSKTSAEPLLMATAQDVSAHQELRTEVDTLRVTVKRMETILEGMEQRNASKVMEVTKRSQDHYNLPLILSVAILVVQIILLLR